jgi:transglutaminase-like putative cysteine protease
VDLQPPDFHGFMQAFLDDQWYLFDPTKLAPISGLVRIRIGRDAADVAFATLNGSAHVLSSNIWAKNSAPTDKVAIQPRNPAISTA